jgi:hypothetical protein
MVTVDICPWKDWEKDRINGLKGKKNFSEGVCVGGGMERGGGGGGGGGGWWPWPPVSDSEKEDS